MSDILKEACTDTKDTRIKELEELHEKMMKGHERLFSLIEGRDGTIATLTAKITRAVDAGERAGAWMSAAISDPSSCNECKKDFSDMLEAMAELKRSE